MDTATRIGEAYAGRRVLVLGATGFIGRFVAGRLVRGGSEACLVARRRPRRPPGRARTREIDLRDLDAVRALIRDAKPEVVFNLAGYGVAPDERDPDAAQRINAELVEVLCEALADSSSNGGPARRLVHVGSALEYGARGGDLSEDLDGEPTTLYGRTKLAGTRAVARAGAAHGLPALTARLFMVYGPGEHPHRLLPALTAAARDAKPVDLTSGSQRRDFTYVEDAAEGLLRLGLAPGPPGEVINLATGVLTPVRAFVECAAEALRIPREHLRFGALPVRAEEMCHDPVRIDRLRRRTGWAPGTPVAAGIRRTLEQLEGPHASA